MATATAAHDREAQIELTWRGLILGAAITIVFTAANVYLGLKIGLTFATSIPAAVISMAVLRAFRSATIFENNIVQTVASAAGTLSSIIFVLPGLVMVGWWTGFPYWESFAICVTGGILGVMYSVPLRRALVAQSDLPYPEGVAAAEVLKVGVGSRGETAASIDENKKGLLTLVVSSIVSAVFALVVATRLFVGSLAYQGTLQGYVRVGAGATGFGVGLSLALLGAGHLIGLAVGSAIFVGLFLAWGVLTPLLSALHPMAGDAATVASTVWAHQVRFIGAGTIGISAIWTIFRLAKPVWTGVASAIAASRARTAAKGDSGLPRTERDLPIGIVGIISLACFIPIAALLAIFVHGTALESLTVPLVVMGVLYIVIAGFFVAAACGYMAGLIGSSNSPVSGLGILSVIGAALVLVVVGKTAGPAGAPALVAYALFVTAVLLNVATISNDNLQDLKTGQLVDATPWRQQVALIAGVIFGALVIPPILSLLNTAYGFGASGRNPLPAPQATLISALAKGVIQGKIDWGLIGWGVLIGIGIIIIDEALRARTKWQLPPLAVGLGIYLPASTTAGAVIGAVVGYAYNRWVAGKPFGEVARRLGVLVASGFIVGESLFGVLNAGVIVAAKSQDGLPFALVGDAFATASNWIGAIAFIVVVWLMYRWTAGLARKSAAD